MTTEKTLLDNYETGVHLRPFMDKVIGFYSVSQTFSSKSPERPPTKKDRSKCKTNRSISWLCVWYEIRKIVISVKINTFLSLKVENFFTINWYKMVSTEDVRIFVRNVKKTETRTLVNYTIWQVVQSSFHISKMN